MHVSYKYMAREVYTCRSNGNITCILPKHHKIYRSCNIFVHFILLVHLIHNTDKGIRRSHLSLWFPLKPRSFWGHSSLFPHLDTDLYLRGTLEPRRNIFRIPDLALTFPILIALCAVTHNLRKGFGTGLWEKMPIDYWRLGQLADHQYVGQFVVVFKCTRWSWLITSI